MVLSTEVIKVSGYFIKKSDNIFEIGMEDHFHIELKDVIMLREKILELSENTEEVSLIIISGDQTTISKEAREYASNSSINCKAEAVVINKLYQKIIVNFMMNFTKKTSPYRNMKVFNCKEKALKWIESQYDSFNS